MRKRDLLPCHRIGTRRLVKRAEERRMGDYVK